MFNDPSKPIASWGVKARLAHVTLTNDESNEMLLYKSDMKLDLCDNHSHYISHGFCIKMCGCKNLSQRDHNSTIIGSLQGKPKF